MTGQRRPRGVKIAAMLMFLSAATLLYAAFTALALANDLLSLTQEYFRDFGPIFQVFGVIDGLIALLFLAVGIGLLLMQDWVIPFGIRVCEFGMLMAFLALNPVLIVSTVLVFIYLRMPTTRDAFDAYEYERPQLPYERRPAVVTAGRRRPTGPAREDSTDGLQPPEGFLACPRCGTMNPETRKRCRICATQLS